MIKSPSQKYSSHDINSSHDIISPAPASKTSAPRHNDSFSASSNSEPLVSIVIPVYNTGVPAAKLIKTLLSSPYQNLEIIAIDDGSTDDSLKYLRAIRDPQKSHNPHNPYKSPKPSQTPQNLPKSSPKSRLRVLSQKNSGPSVARNLGIKHAHGKYIAFFDSDDSVDPRIIPEFVRALESPAPPSGLPTQKTTQTPAPSTPKTAQAPATPAQKTVQTLPAPLLALCAYRYHRVRQGTTTPIYTSPLTPPRPGDTFPAYLLRLLLADGRLYAVINKLFRTSVIKTHHLAFDASLNFAEDTKFVLEYLKYAYHDIISSNSSASSNPTNSPRQYSPHDINSSHDISSLITSLPAPLYHYNYGTATSTVSKSSLPWQNWQTSLQNLETWLRTDATGRPRTPTDRELSLFRKVATRWHISHALAVARANLPLREKRQYLSYPCLFLARLALLVRK